MALKDLDKSDEAAEVLQKIDQLGDAGELTEYLARIRGDLEHETRLLKKLPMDAEIR